MTPEEKRKALSERKRLEREAKDAGRAAPAQAESKVTRSQPSAGGGVCVKRGEVLGKLDCGCQGKPFVYVCTDTQNEQGMCTDHASKPRRRKVIQLSNGNRLEYGPDDLQACSLCAYREGDSKYDEMRDSIVSELERKVTALLRRKMDRIDQLNRRAQESEDRAKALRSDASVRIRSLTDELNSLVKSLR